MERHHPLAGHTFCTVEQFSSVSKAIDECAFILSELPVILSLEYPPPPPFELRAVKLISRCSRIHPTIVIDADPCRMHCSPKQQHALARMLVGDLGDAVLQVRCTLPCPCALACHHEPHHRFASLAEATVPSQFNELAATGQALSLSPIALAKRILLKGKVNIVTKQNPLHQTRTTSHGEKPESRDDSGVHKLFRTAR